MGSPALPVDYDLHRGVAVGAFVTVLISQTKRLVYQRADSGKQNRRLVLNDAD